MKIIPKDKKTKNSDTENVSWLKVLVPIIFLAVFTVLVLIQRQGIGTNEKAKNKGLSNLTFSEPVESTKECLVITDTSDEITSEIASEVEFVLSDMRVNYTVKDVSELDLNNDLSDVQTVVFAFEDWNRLGNGIQNISEFVKNGGGVFAAMSPEPTGNLNVIKQRLGILDGGMEYAGITGIKAVSDSIIGEDVKADYSLSLEEGEKFETSLSVQLDENAKVYFSSSDGKVPILWSSDYGKGRFVILNDAIVEKFQRGFYCIGYSLLKKACIYPVINASAYYLDDFPSPVPGGDNSYIMRDYGVDTSTFYSNIWLPQIITWEKKYGIKHTGMIIEDYNDNVKKPFPTQMVTEHFSSFGNTLLNNGGELGLHGYNHEPLCIQGVDDSMKYGYYRLWKDDASVEAAVKELTSFSKKLFPDNDFIVYVPPSNILSDEGEKALLTANPDIKIIASTYTASSDAPARVQEFTVEDNGIIDTPRIASGTMIDDYMYLTEFSELNYHYVQTHFCHPDDVLDPDRGADEGWEKMSETFENYLKYVTKSAPKLRQVTGSKMGEDVEIYHNLSMNVKEKDNEIDVALGGFSGEAYFMLRINSGKIGSVTGCSVEKAAENLYLVHARSDKLTIGIK